MSRARLVTILLFLLPANVIFLTPSQAQVPVFVDGINLTTTPSPGSGHDYIKMLNETVNPANGSLSVRIEAPTPKQRGDVNFPFYIFGYDTGGVSFPTGQINYTSQGNTGFSVPNLGIEWEDSVFHGCGLGAVPGGFLANGGIGQVCSQNVALSAQILPNASAPNAPLLMATCSYVTGFVYKDPRGGATH